MSKYAFRADDYTAGGKHFDPIGAMEEHAPSNPKPTSAGTYHKMVHPKTGEEMNVFVPKKGQ